MSETPAQVRARLLEEQARAQRAALLKRAPPARDADDDKLASATAASPGAGHNHPPPEELPDPAPPRWQRVGRAIGDLAARVVDKAEWQRGRVFNPKVLVADITTPARTIKPPPNWARDVIEDFALSRQVNVDISLPYAMTIADELEKFASDGRGFFQRAFASIGKAAMLGRVEGSWGKETVRKFVRWLQRRGWIGVLNSLYRREEDNKLVRDSNVYFLFGREEAAEVAALDVSAGAVLSENRTKSVAARIWNAIVTPYGVNKPRTKSNRRHIRTRSAPA